MYVYLFWGKCLYFWGSILSQHDTVAQVCLTRNEKTSVCPNQKNLKGKYYETPEKWRLFFRDKYMVKMSILQVLKKHALMQVLKIAQGGNL